MSYHKWTHDDYLKKFNSMEGSKNLKIIGTFTGFGTKFEVECLYCGNRFYSSPQRAYENKSGCKKCAFKSLSKQHLLSHEEYLERFKQSESSKHIKLLGEYAGAKAKILVECLHCGEKFSTNCETALKLVGGCRNCAAKKGASNRIIGNDEFLSRLKLYNPHHDTIEPLEEYVGIYEPMKMQCNTCGTEWSAVPNNLLRKEGGTGCPHCTGYNKASHEKYEYPISVTDPIAASWLANSEDGNIYTRGSSQKLDWKCPTCGLIVKNKPIDKVVIRGIYCPSCSNNASYPNRFMYNLLLQTGLNENDIETEKTFAWSNSRFYDFYIPRLSMIIEVHGCQHYEEVRYTKRTLKEEKQNDEYKYQMAIDNGIKHYITIDARESSLNHMKQSVLESNLGDFLSFETVNWDLCHYGSIKSHTHDIFKMKTVDGKSTEEISEITGLSKPCIRKRINKYIKKIA